MNNLPQAILLLAGVLASIYLLMWFERRVIVPHKIRLNAPKRKPSKARRMCSEHIICLNVEGSMAILDETGGCYLCLRN